MHLSKSYALLRFLNKRHSIPSRALFVLAGWWGVLLTSFQFRLANRAASILWSDDFKTGLRLIHWFVRRGWPELDLANDPYFDFSSCFKPDELNALETFLASRAQPKNAFEDACDRLFVLAARIHLALEQNDIPEFERRKVEFEALKRQIPLISPPHTHKSSPSPKENVFSKVDANAALKAFAALAKEIGLEWYVISGTFLGIVREAGWLDHDYDIDLGVNAESIDLEKLRNAILSRADMVLRKEDWQSRIIVIDGLPTIERLPALFKIVHLTGINIDLFVHHLENGIRWHGSNIHRWNNTEFSLNNYDLDGINVLGPANGDLYLTENYGNWRTPVKEFNSVSDTTNMVPTPNYISAALFQKRHHLHAFHSENTNNAS